MKKSFKLPLALCTSLCVIMPLVSCSSTTPQNSDSNETSETFDSVKVVFGTTFGDKVETAVQKYIDKFEQLVYENEGVNVTIEQYYLGGYSDVSTKIQTYFQSGDSDMPNITVAYPDTVADFIYNFGTDYVVNVEDYLNDSELAFGTDKYYGDTISGTDDFVSSFIEEGRCFTVDGLYVMPYMKSSEIMIYNVDLATRAMKYYDNEAVETGRVEQKIASMSWDELIEFAYVCKEHASDLSNNLEYPIFYDSDSNLFITQMYQEGYSYSYVEDGKGVIGFDDKDESSDSTNYAGAKKLLEQYQQWHKDGIFTTKGTEGTYASNSFKNEECIFTIGSSGGAGYTFPSAGEFNMSVVEVPARNSTDYYISQGPSVCFLRNPSFSTAKNDIIQKYAWKFYKYITSTEVNAALCIGGSEGYIPVRNSSYATETFLDFLEEGENYALAAKVLTEDISPNYLTSAVFPGSATLRDQVGGAVTACLAQGTDPDKALEDVINNTKVDMR